LVGGLAIGAADQNSVVYRPIRVASDPGKLLIGVYDEDDNYVDDTALNGAQESRAGPA
jgi:hypothetical protein